MRAGPAARTLWVLFIAAPCPLACGHAPPPPAAATRMEPIHLKADLDGDDLSIEAYTAEDLFEAAGEDLRAGRWEAAIARYDRLIAEFDGSSLRPPSHFNRGLCLMRLDRHEEAAASFLAMADLQPNSPDVADALFNAAAALEAAKLWEGAVAALDRLLTGTVDLSGGARLEALARKGAALVELGRDDEARWILEEAVRMYRFGRDAPPVGSIYHYSMARFTLARIVHNRMRAAPLPADETVLEEHLERKAALLLEAQRKYSDVIRIGHPEWAAAAAYSIGALYHHLRVDMLDAPPPADLGSTEREIYLEILRDRTRVLLRKAILQWERTLKLAARLGLENEWIERTNAEIVEIRAALSMEDASAANGDVER